MKILGIETSCDETACAIVEDGRIVLGSVIASQIDIHAATGGVVPEVAAREHVLKIVPVIEECLKKAALGFDGVDGIAVTRGPGLLSSLIIGYSAAATLARFLKVPLIPVHHVAGHIYSNWLEQGDGGNGSGEAGGVSAMGMEEKSDISKIKFPVMVLTVSGGHNELVLLREEMEFQLIGETLDDAAGEAFDKVARLLGLGYPGGPAISRVGAMGDAKAFDLPRAMLKSKDFNFSFSGLKTAVRQLIEKEHAEKGELSEKFKMDCAASFEECVADILSEKLLKAAEEYGVSEIHLAGGVSANKRLRAMIAAKLARKKLPITFRYNQDLNYCTDNAAMIAGAGFYLYQKNPAAYSPTSELLPDPQLNLYLK